jgi:hypothetical protein
LITGKNDRQTLKPDIWVHIITNYNKSYRKRDYLRW